jgi:hypothetical protein
MAGNNSNAGMIDLASYELDPPTKKNDQGEISNKIGKIDDLIIEDNWNYDAPIDNQAMQPVKTKSKRQELIEAQKNKLAKKKYAASDNNNNINYEYKKKQNDGPGLDSIYETEVKPQINKYDAELDGEIQHESLKKKKLEGQRQNNKVEFTAANPALLLKNKQNDNQILGKVNMVNLEGAQVEYGNYDDEKTKKKKKKKKKNVQQFDEDGNPIESTELTELDGEETPAGSGAPVAATFEQPKYDEYDEDGAPAETSAKILENNNEGEGDKKKKKKKKKKGQDEEQKFDSEDNPILPSREETDENNDDDGGEEDEEKRKQRKEKKKEKKNKRKEEILRIKNAFMEKLISPFTEVEELRKMFTQPLPKEVGILECTILRNKSGFNFWNPKYTLVISDGERFLLNGKKQSGNKTSNYWVTLDQDNMKKKGKGFLGKLRANFMGTEFVIYDDGENPTKTKNIDEVRNEMASVLYESNVLGSKGPRKMRVIIPAIDKEDNI